MTAREEIVKIRIQCILLCISGGAYIKNLLLSISAEVTVKMHPSLG